MEKIYTKVPLGITCKDRLIAGLICMLTLYGEKLIRGLIYVLTDYKDKIMQGLLCVLTVYDGRLITRGSVYTGLFVLGENRARVSVLCIRSSAKEVCP